MGILDAPGLTRAQLATPRRGNCWFVVGAGQSNTASTDSTTFSFPRPGDPRIARYNITTQALESMNPGDNDLVNAFARQLVERLPAGDWICTVNTQVPGTGFNQTTGAVDGTTVTNSWSTTNTTATANLATRAVNLITAAKAAITAQGATIVPTAILWSQGENDTQYLTTAQYQGQALALFTSLRTAVGDNTTPLLIGSMTPEFAALRGYSFTADVATALSGLPQVVDHAAQFYGPTGHAKASEVIHFSGPGQIIRGSLALDALDRARTSHSTSLPVAPEIVSTTRDGLTVTVKWRPSRSRHTSLTAEFSTDGGTTWAAGTIDPDSRLFATYVTEKAVQFRIRATNTGATITTSEYNTASIGAASPPAVDIGLPLVTGVYYGAPTSSVSTTIPPEGKMEGVPWVAGRSCTLTRIGLEVTVAGAAGAVIRLGLYVYDPVADTLTRLVDAGTIDGTVASYQELTISQAVTAGQILVPVAAVQGAAATRPTVRQNSPGPTRYFGHTTATAVSQNNNFSISSGSGTGALPASVANVIASGFTNLNTATSARVLVKV